MNNYEKIYNELRKKYSDEDIAASMLIPETLTEEEQAAATEELLMFRYTLLKNQNKEKQIYFNSLRHKFLRENDVNIGVHDV